jgi:uncharacterized protein (TIGR02421 family)
VPEFGKRGEVRQTVGNAGRIHLDRWLPFIVLHRSPDPSASIARRIAINSPAYLIWTPEDDRSAEDALHAIAAAIHERFGCILGIVVEDAAWDPVLKHSEELSPFDIRVGATGGWQAQGARNCLIEALTKIRVDLREPKIQQSPASPPPLDVNRGDVDIDLLSVVIPQIHRHDETTVYPQLTRDLAVAVGDALLQAACAFMAESRAGAPAHFRSLGRSAFLAAALDADKKLDKVARSFDFLLSVSPINNRQAMERFLSGGEQETPKFRYRPLTIEPAAAKRDLYAIDLSIIEDPLLERLLAEKRHELDHQLTMLSTRNSPAFKAASLLQYGTVGSQLLADAHAILARPRDRKSRGEAVGAAEVANAALTLVHQYQSAHGSFDASIQIRDDVGGLLVSGNKLLISSSASILRSRLDALLAHEVSVHLLTHFNGAAQGLTVFRTGLANYEGLQEGLGVFAEWAVGGLSEPRMRLLAGRVVAVEAMLDGAEFIDVYRRLVDDCGLPRKAAFDITARVFRSGGFAKDLIYLKGFQQVIGLVAAGASLDAYWIGKIGCEHASAVEELIQRKLVHPPLFKPEFLQRKDVERRIARLRGETSMARIFGVE